jgi:glycosyltransferase 2 family protein
MKNIPLWKSLPPRVRSLITFLLKAVVTVGAFYLLLSHKITPAGGGPKASALAVIRDYLPGIDMAVFWRFIFIATAIKAVGIACSIYRWSLLLKGQGIVFPFWHLVGTFLIGRFIGTFTPGTIGLDGYKLWDAAHYSRKGIEATAATAIEKVLGIVGIFLTFLITLPLGFRVLETHFGGNASRVAFLTVSTSIVIIAAFFLMLFKPGIIQFFITRIPLPKKARLQSFVERVNRSAAAYQHHKGLLLNAAFQAFMVHFTTAVMYFFTALAIGASGANLWEVTFASSIQIFATVISPFTIAGEGVREIITMVLLGKLMGTGATILFAALGFWAAEALTLFGGFFLWARRKSYAPAFVILDGTRHDPRQLIAEAGAA